jgi:phosphomannomutase
VYWKDGGQLVPPQDHEIIAEIEQLQFNEIKFEANHELINELDETTDQAFINDVIKNGSFSTPTEAKNKLNIAFTSLHGTSITLVPKTLQEAGYKNLHIVEEQAEPNGDFPTVKSPNPEEPEALELALKLGKKTNSDLVIGTDPDSDRLGIAVRDLQGELQLLNGNQTMVLMTAFLLEQWHKNAKLNQNEFVASTIVSTPMMRVLTESYGVEYKESLTGFKWIAKLIKDYPELNFIGGGEESFGFMVGDFVRDKDAVTSILLVCEMAAQLKANGLSLYEKLIQLYIDHGYFKEKLVALVKKGIEGAEEIKQKMISLRQQPIETIDGEKIVLIEDYQTSIATNKQDHSSYSLTVPKSNVLIFYTENGTKVAARPSGTEPKIKFYISVNSALSKKEDFNEVSLNLEAKLNRIITELGIA